MSKKESNRKANLIISALVHNLDGYLEVHEYLSAEIEKFREYVVTRLAGVPSDDERFVWAVQTLLHHVGTRLEYVPEFNDRGYVCVNVGPDGSVMAVASLMESRDQRLRIQFSSDLH